MSSLMNIANRSVRSLNKSSGLPRCPNDQQSLMLQLVLRKIATVPATQDNNSSPHYVSPFQNIYDRIEDGKTFLGTTRMTKSNNSRRLKCGISEDVLRFKTSSYGRFLQEPFVSPNEHRVTLSVAVRDIPLEPIEMMILKEIAGTRLSDSDGMLQLSSTQFGSRIENKRHVVSMLDRLLLSSRSLAKRMQETGLGASATDGLEA